MALREASKTSLVELFEAANLNAVGIKRVIFTLKKRPNYLTYL